MAIAANVRADDWRLVHYDDDLPVTTPVLI
jgi:hypothetical protein